MDNTLRGLIGLIIIAVLCMAFGTNNVFGQSTRKEVVILFNQAGASVSFNSNDSITSDIEAELIGYHIDSIIGFASIEGSNTSNMTLSERRAESVARALSTDIVEVYGRGETNQFGDSLWLNRRVIVYASLSQSVGITVDTIWSDDKGFHTVTTTTYSFSNDTPAVEEIVTLDDSIITVDTTASIPADTTTTDTIATMAVAHPFAMSLPSIGVVGEYCDPNMPLDTMFSDDAVKHYMSKGLTRAQAGKIVKTTMRKGRYVKDSKGQWTLETKKPAKKRIKRTKMRRTRGLSARGGILNVIFPFRNC